MSCSKKNIAIRKKRRTFRVRNKFKSRELKPRIAVFRSLKHIYAQIIDDKEHKTLLSGSSHSLSGLSGKEAAKQIGLELGKKAVEANIKDVFFDRGKFLYHGRIQALAEGLREGGLNF